MRWVRADTIRKTELERDSFGKYVQIVLDISFLDLTSKETLEHILFQ